MQNLHELYGRMTEQCAILEQRLTAERNAHAATTEQFYRLWSEELSQDQVVFTGTDGSRQYTVKSPTEMLLAGLKSGEVTMDQVELNGENWTVKPTAVPEQVQPTEQG